MAIWVWPCDCHAVLAVFLAMSDRANVILGSKLANIRDGLAGMLTIVDDHFTFLRLASGQHGLSLGNPPVFSGV